ncbi:hypothetical protein [Thermoflavimicrobium dichotomicum]|uniref:Uncharacterized protein n=1 Tax=Thermoflavimicrobium dichotomicum TaxID=46223 RepID=A0A1I3QBS6_9BACL|nr:hypothetical protein [Thermoflavimicrobium dichotomicum]SFJ30771.1 hypothetical protein SAMN05421852_10780 [Thermoflavimicrobium dichotomicum]
MSQVGDTLVLYLLIGVIIYLMIKNIASTTSVKGWLFSSKEKSESISFTGKVPMILQEHGYEVIDEKIKIPIAIDLDGEAYSSRMFVDYLARNEEGTYLVMVARERKPLRLSGSALRDYFLPYFLLFEPSGILYVDKEKGSIKLIHLDVPDMKLKKRKSALSGYVIASIVGMILALLLYQNG